MHWESWAVDGNGVEGDAVTELNYGSSGESQMVKVPGETVKKLRGYTHACYFQVFHFHISVLYLSCISWCIFWSSFWIPSLLVGDWIIVVSVAYIFCLSVFYGSGVAGHISSVYRCLFSMWSFIFTHSAVLCCYAYVLLFCCFVAYACSNVGVLSLWQMSHSVTAVDVCVMQSGAAQSGACAICTNTTFNCGFVGADLWKVV